jgi:glutathione-regulated potassium-efflux system ancillary protein KefG
LKNILILFAHPAFQKSRVNRQLTAELANISGVTLHDLYQCYPDFDIDIQQEQQLLVDHDVIVFHHPFFWYSTPAILKEWQDLVLQHGWAYGRDGNALQGKLFFNAITTGGGAEAYCEHGYNFYTMRQLLAPIEQTVKLCKMIFLPPYVVHGTHALDDAAIGAHKQTYHRILERLRDDRFDPAKVVKLNYLNDWQQA